MPPTRHHIRTLTDAYLARHPDEQHALAPLLKALTRPEDPTSRKTYPGHITCSAIVINHHDHVLHIHHTALNKALAPGGHTEPDDPDLPTAALRELHEETGIPPKAVTPIPQLNGLPLDIDVHDIAANPDKNEPAHQHYDFRFAFQLIAEHHVSLQTEEVTDYRWLTLTEIPAPTIAAKLAALPRSTHP